MLGAIGQAYIVTQFNRLWQYNDEWATVRLGSSFVLGIAAQRAFSAFTELAGGAWALVAGDSRLCTVIEGASFSWVVYIFSHPFMYSDFIAPWSFAAMVICFAWGGGWVSYGLRALQLLGTISFSIYLNHVAVM